MRYLIDNIKNAALLWYDKDSDYSAAVVSYYSLFATVPLILLSVTMVSWLYDKQLVVETLYKWGSVFPPELVELLHMAVVNLQDLSIHWHVPFIGILFFSSMVIVFFNSVASGLHQQWSLSHRGVRGWIHKTERSLLFTVVFEFYLVAVIGFDLMVASLSDSFGWVMAVLSIVFFVLTTTVLFALAYHILPQESPSLRSRIIGAFLASLTLAVVRSLVTMYIAITPVPGLYGAAGVLFILLLWAYVFACVFYFGAAFAHVYSNNSLNN